jgi:hypothetical protein
VLLRGRTAAGGEASIYVKTRAGYGDRPAAPGIELFTTLLARELGLLAPEPVLVLIPDTFHSVIFEAPMHRELVRLSPGTNFGTISLGTDWKTWPVEMPARSFSPELIESIVAFDGLVQHTDRTPENPNLLWRERQIAIYDHEKCFGYLPLAADNACPWREFFCLKPFRTHCLRPAITESPSPDFAGQLRENLIDLELNQRLPELIGQAQEAFPSAEMELRRVLRYLDLLHRNRSDFFDYLRLSVQP